MGRGEIKPLVNGEFVLEKFPGKGGWTYAALPGVKLEKGKPFGWLQVKGNIDGHKLSQYKLMPMGNGDLFLPVRKEIRKVIGKERGDVVQVTLYRDDTSIEVPKEIMVCFEYETESVRAFWLSLKDWEKKAFVDWICLAKTEDTRAERIARMMVKLSKGMKFHDKEF